MASIHMPHLPVEQREVLVEPVGRGAWRARVGHQIEVEVQRVRPRLAVELRVPVLVEPARAEAVGRGRDEGGVLAPAGLAAQADAVDLVVLVGHGAGSLGDEVPSGGLRHLEPGLLHQVGAIHHHRALTVERRGIEFAIDGEAAADRRQQVVDVIAFRQIVQADQPTLLAPDRNLVGADGHDVVLATLGGDVRGHTLAQDVLLQRHPLQFDARVLGGKVVGQTLHTDHVAIVDRGDRQRLGSRCRRQEAGGSGGAHQGTKLDLHRILSMLALSNCY